MVIFLGRTRATKVRRYEGGFDVHTLDKMVANPNSAMAR